MIIYNPDHIIQNRIKEAEALLNQIPAKYCFITGSFIHQKKYQDIDLFIITRSKKEFKNKKVKITILDFNDLHSLFYHSISKTCLAKNILPKKPLKVTLSDYWQVINEAIPTLLNQKDKFHKDVRFLILYTEYFKTNQVLDTYELNQKIKQFKDYHQILEYIKKEIPEIINKKIKRSYSKRFFYTQAGFYKDVKDKYDAQNILYELTHSIARGAVHG